MKQFEDGIICTPEDFWILKKALKNIGVTLKAVSMNKQEVKCQLINPHRDFADNNQRDKIDKFMEEV